MQSAVLHVVCPPVCLSMTSVDCDHIGWNSSKIISHQLALGCSLCATQTSQVYSKGNTPKFSPEQGWGTEKGDFRRTKALISLMRQDAIRYDRRGCRRLGEKPVGRKTFGRIIFWATDGWATTVISKKTFRRKTVRRQGLSSLHSC